MVVELRPLGVMCNIACQYCYQHPQRDVEEFSKRYDLEAMKSAVLREGGPFTLFGGEALLVPVHDLEKLWAWGYEKFGRNGLQTNGSLITDVHISLFKKFKVDVGMSMDGPDDLNDARWAGSLELTRKMTRQSARSIEKLCKAGIPPAIIITLHRKNVLPDKFFRMTEWIKALHAMGVCSFRLHLMEVENESIRKVYHLDTEEYIEALLFFQKLKEELVGIQFDIFDDIEKLQKGDDDCISCVWNGCDPFTTAAVRGVEGFGQRSNCGRTNKEGIDFVKAPMPSYVRYISLYHTPQESGGCKGCRFFAMCKGHCPGTAIEGDWRNRNEHCEVIKKLFQLAEDKFLASGETPLSKHPVLPYIEKSLLNGWQEGNNLSIQSILTQIVKQQRC